MSFWKLFRGKASPEPARQQPAALRRPRQEEDATPRVAVVPLPEKLYGNPPEGGHPAQADCALAHALRDNLLNLVSTGRCSRLVLDFSKTRFIDSGGLGTLEIVRREAAPRGIPLAFAAMQANIRDVFRITGMDGLFPIFDTVEAAMGSEIRQP